jgi:uncharacterized HAD superfamily protein
MVTPDQQRISDQLVRLVQVLFALVLGQSLLTFKVVLLNPFAPAHRLAALAWLTVFYTTVASWVDWHVTMARRPYDTLQLIDRFRFYSDVGIAALYAYLLFTIQPLVDDQRATLAYHLLGYALIFVLYLSSGFLRRWVHGKAASKPKPLFIGLALYVGLLLVYVYLRRSNTLEPAALNLASIAAAFALMFAYRRYRRILMNEDAARAARLRIGVDVDGVLADQISGVLPRVKERYDVTLSYADITEWELPIKNSNIAVEIVDAQRDHQYVLGMAAHEGAKRVLDYLHELHRIVVITARRGEAATKWTAEWLRKHGIPYDEVIASSEAKKSEHRTDLLIDDYCGNISEFLTNTKGVAVLVDQPWNRQRGALEEFVKSGRLFIVSDLLELRMTWPEISKKARESLIVGA